MPYTVTMRTLHLVGPETFGFPASAAFLVDSAGNLTPQCQADVLYSGPPSDGKVRPPLILPSVTHIRPRLSRSLAVWNHLRKLAKRRQLPDLLHAWTVADLTGAVTALTDRPCLLTLHRPLTPREGVKLAGLVGEAVSPLHFLACSSTIKRQACSVGVRPDSISILRPGFDFGRLDHRSIAAVRKELAVAEHEKLLVILGEPESLVELDHAALAACLAFPDAGSRDQPGIKILIDREHPLAPRVRRMMSGLGRDDALCMVDLKSRYFQWLPACDLALLPGEQGGGLNMIHAMASNLAIVAEADYATAELLEDRHTALMTAPGDRPGLARQLAKLAEDRQLAWQLRDQARHECYSFFSRQRYRKNLALVYQQMVEGAPVTIPDMEPTGGLRFSGRA